MTGRRRARAVNSVRGEPAVGAGQGHATPDPQPPVFLPEPPGGASDANGILERRGSVLDQRVSDLGRDNVLRGHEQEITQPCVLRSRAYPAGGWYVAVGMWRLLWYPMVYA